MRCLLLRSRRTRGLSIDVRNGAESRWNESEQLCNPIPQALFSISIQKSQNRNICEIYDISSVKAFGGLFLFGSSVVPRREGGNAPFTFRIGDQTIFIANKISGFTGGEPFA